MILHILLRLYGVAASFEGIFRVGGNKKGIFTRDRQPKSAAFVLKKRWEEI
ncbi:MAG: hypothetical protein J6M92_06795 [Oribacterium sp.]|nr:hypothetical protein [Oribacterium sp.]